MEIEQYNYFNGKHLFWEDRLLNDRPGDSGARGGASPGPGEDTERPEEPEAEEPGAEEAGAEEAGAEDAGAEEAAGETETPEAGAADERIALDAEVSGDVAPTLRPSQKLKLPEGKWANAYDKAIELRERYRDPTSRQIAMLAAQFCAWMAINGEGILSLFSNFKDKLNNDDYSKEKFKTKEVDSLMTHALRTIPLNDASGFKAADYEGLSKAHGSLKYVSLILFGPGNKIPNQKVLAARLLHSKTGIHKYYGEKTLEELTKPDRDIPRGTVIFFTPNGTNDILVAYAMGDRKKFVYYIPGLDEPEIFDLDPTSSKCPIQTEFDLKLAFVPNFNTDPSYFSDPDNAKELIPEVDQSPFGIVTSAITEADESTRQLDSYLSTGSDLSSARVVQRLLDYGNKPIKVLKETEKVLLTLGASVDEDVVAFVAKVRPKLKESLTKFLEEIKRAHEAYGLYYEEKVKKPLTEFNLKKGTVKAKLEAFPEDGKPEDKAILEKELRKVELEIRKLDPEDRRAKVFLAKFKKQKDYVEAVLADTTLFPATTDEPESPPTAVEGSD